MLLGFLGSRTSGVIGNSEPRIRAPILRVTSCRFVFCRSRRRAEDETQSNGKTQPNAVHTTLPKFQNAFQRRTRTREIECAGSTQYSSRPFFYTVPIGKKLLPTYRDEPNLVPYYRFLGGKVPCWCDKSWELG